MYFAYKIIFLYLYKFLDILMETFICQFAWLLALRKSSHVILFYLDCVSHFLGLQYPLQVNLMVWICLCNLHYHNLFRIQQMFDTFEHNYAVPVWLFTLAYRSCVLIYLKYRFDVLVWRGANCWWFLRLYTIQCVL